MAARFGAAVELFRQACTNASATATNFYWLGTAEFHRMLQLLGLPESQTNKLAAGAALDAAVAALTQAVKLDASHAESHALLGTLYGMKISAKPAARRMAWSPRAEGTGTRAGHRRKKSARAIFAGHEPVLYGMPRSRPGAKRWRPCSRRKNFLKRKRKTPRGPAGTALGPRQLPDVHRFLLRKIGTARGGGKLFSQGAGAAPARRPGAGRPQAGHERRKMSGKKIIVIGAGLGGLSAAISLKQAGYDVEVFEKNAQIGGKLNVLKERGYTFDLGPSILTLPHIFERLFERSGKKMADYFSIRALRPHWRNFFEDGVTLDLHPEPEKMAAEARKAGEPPENIERFLKYSAGLYDLTNDGYFEQGLDNWRDFARHYGALEIFSVRSFPLDASGRGGAFPDAPLPRHL